MCQLIALFVITLATTAIASNEEASESTSTTAQPLQPVYKPPQQPPTYIPHQTYPYSDSYGFFYPQLYQAQQPTYSEQQAQPNYMSAVIPAAQVDSVPHTIALTLQLMGALQFALKVLAKFGLFVLGGAALLVIGGIFTTVICHLTPICVISFPALGGLDKESVRSLMTPDKISAAAALVQDAIGKYQRLQRAAKV